MFAQRLRFGGELRVLGFVVIAAGAAVAEVFFGEAFTRPVLRFARSAVGAARRRVFQRAGQRRCADGFFADAVVAFGQRIFLQEFFAFLVEFKGGTLQQPDRQLQLRRQRQMLGQPELERVLHGSGRRVAASGAWAVAGG